MFATWPVPTFPLMSGRQSMLLDAIAGLKATGVGLVGLRGQRLFAAGFDDDPGFYYFVPQLARVLDISPNAATWLFFGGMLGLAVLVGSMGWSFYARDLRSRILGIAGILLVACLSLAIGDMYVLLAALVLTAVPPLLALWRRNPSNSRWIAVLVPVGIVVGIGASARSEAGFPVLVFASVLLLARNTDRLSRRFVRLFTLLAAIATPVLAVRAVQAHRDAYLAREVADYVKPKRTHPFWHPVYLGFGYLSNEHVTAYLDEVAMARVAAIAPGTPNFSPEYEAVLRREVLNLIVSSPLLVVRTIAAKFGVLCLYLAVFANIGLVASWRYRKPPVLELAFAAALAIASVPAILTIPNTSYLEGFIALSVLYAAVSCEWVLGMQRRREGPTRLEPTPT
jgi:hypothetical protein